MRIGSLCSGYGGLEMGVQAVYGGTTAWVSDIDKGACKILAHRFPGVPNIGDMTAVDWSAIEPVDLICGGTPCQDLSHAGRRAGMTEGTRSNLWVAMREAIATIRPQHVVWENVGGAYSAAADSSLERDAGLLGDGPGRPALRALGRVLGDLASLGYDARWHGIRAADIGAPHGRFRVFVVAADARRKSREVPATRRLSTVEVAAGDGDSRRVLLPTPRATDGAKGGPNQRGSSGDLMLSSAVALLPTPSVADVDGGRKGRSGDRSNELLLNGIAAEARWGDYAAAIARWERVLGRPAPEPTMTSRKGNPQLAPAFVEWMMGLPAGWITDVPEVTRNEALRALGNGVVPQQAAAALLEMASWEAAA